MMYYETLQKKESEPGMPTVLLPCDLNDSKWFKMTPSWFSVTRSDYNGA